MQPLNKTAALEAIPVVNPTVQINRTSQDLIRITYSFRMNSWLTRLLPTQMTKGYRTLELDALGTFVWEQIDGNRSVLDIAAKLEDKFKLHRQEVEQSLASFLRELGTREIIAIKASAEK